MEVMEVVTGRLDVGRETVTITARVTHARWSTSGKAESPTDMLRPALHTA